MFERTRSHLSLAGLLVAVVALVLALGGSAIAAGSAPSGEAQSSATRHHKKKKEQGLNKKQRTEVEKTAKKFQGTGPQGAPGAPGANGVNGTKGDAGPQGPVGPQGPRGATGATGAAGSNGAKGATGATGSKGATGAAGSNGAKGATGAAGNDGATGPKGATGAKGATGFSGATGAKGPTGDEGAKGATGDEGAKGPTGDEGAKGPTGDKGPTGASGPSVTEVDTGTGLTGGPITSTGTIEIDPTETQQRITGTCASGEAVTAVEEDGSVVCASAGGGGGWPTVAATGDLMTGAWSYTTTQAATPENISTADTGVHQYAVPISFPVPLSALLDDAHTRFIAEGGSDANCPGSAAEPNAKTGYLCVFQGTSHSSNVTYPRVFTDFPFPFTQPFFPTPGTNGAIRTGTRLIAAIGAGDAWDGGTWAVRAP